MLQAVPRRRVLGVALLAAMASALAPAAAQRSNSQSSALVAVPAHLEAARQLVAHVRPEDTHYQHKHGTVHWKGVDGAAKFECHTDCSGLVNHLLAHSYGITDAELKDWLGTSRPTAKTYHSAIARSNGFTRIVRIEDVRPGDIVAIRYPQDSENTGHTMIVAGPARPHAASRPMVADTRQWEVPVIDSTSSPHGAGDTRQKNDGVGHTGIGQGTFRVYTDAAGKVTGYTWSTAGGSEYRDQQTRNLEFGRLKDAATLKKAARSKKASTSP